MVLNKKMLIAVVAVVVVIAIAAVALVMMGDSDKGTDVVTEKKFGESLTQAELDDLVAAAGKDDKLTLTYRDGSNTVVLDSKAIASLKDASAVTMVKKDTSSLSQKIVDAVGNPVALFDISFGKNTSFGKGNATVTTAYTLPSGVAVDRLAVYSVGQNDNLEKLDASYKSGKVTFVTGHFSRFVIAISDTSEFDYKPVSDVRLVVYGNANNDDVIDVADLRIVKILASKKVAWDSENLPFADANVDGVIDSKDVAILEDIIAKKPTKVYYLDRWDEAVAVNYPIPADSTIGTTYYQQAQISIALGLWDRVTHCGYTSLNDIANPGYTDKVSWGTGYNVSPETVLESGVKTVICYTQTDTTAPQIKELVKKTGADLNVLCINHESLMKCMVTYSFLFDVTERVSEYVDMADDVVESIIKSMTPVPTDKQPSVALVMLYGTATTDKIRVLGYNSDLTKNTHNLAKLFNSVPNVNWVRADKEVEAYGTYVTSEWFITNQPDYIVLVGSSMGTSNDMAESEIYNIFYAKCEEVFGMTEAFKNGRIICASNGLMNGYSNPLVSLKLLSYVYDEIDSDLAEKAYDLWYSKYVMHTPEKAPTEKFYVVGSGSSPQKSQAVNDYTTVKIYGNADNNMTIDKYDLKFIQNIIDGRFSWDSVKNPYVDANMDGKIDAEDLAIVENIIAGNTQEVFYTDIYGDAVKVIAPISPEKIGVSSWQIAELTYILDIWDKVVLASTSTTDSNSLRYDCSNVTGTFKGTNITTELILDNKCDFVIATQGKKDVVMSAVAGNEKIVPYFVDISSSDTCVNTVVTLGILMGLTAEAQKYADYVNGIIDTIKAGMEKVEKKASAVITLMYANQATRSDIIVECEGTGAAALIGLIADVYDSDSKNASNFRLNVTEEFFIEHCGKDFDFIVIEQEGTDTKKVTVDGADSYYTPGMYNERFESAVKYYTMTSAYDAGRILGTTFSYNSFGGYAFLLYLAHLFYPEVFDEEAGWDAVQQYYDEFTGATLDVKAQGGWFYTGSGYTAYNDRFAVEAPAGKDTLLTILGNVDLDDTISMNDVHALQWVISNKGTVENYPYADANNDGKIDASDLDFVMDMVRKVEQEVYYFNVDGNIASVHYPVTGTVIATYNKTLEAIRTLGASDQVIAIDDFSYEWPDYFPEFMNLPSIGSRFTPSVEKVLDLMPSAYLCGTTQWFAKTLETDIGDAPIDVIRLPTWEQGQVLSGMVTLGYLLQKEQQAQAYITWANGILDRVNSYVAGVPDSEKPTVLVLDADKVLSTKKSGSGQFENSVAAGGYNIVSDITSTEEYYTNLTMEYILAKNPDFIVFSQGSTAYKWDDAKLQEKLENLKGQFAGCKAVTDGNFHIVNLEVFIGPSYPISVLCMAKWFYPDEFADMDPMVYLQDYLDNFCNLDMNAVEHGGFAL
ncbi:MAG: ABC transporter substrate-binding protein [archaeon]|nr:ABC transporter substrate-binding protein [archaeon]